MLLYPEDVDRRLNWPLGRAERLSRRKRLPHVVLPDGSIRFDWSEIEPLLRRVSVGQAVIDEMIATGLIIRGDDPRLAEHAEQRRESEVPQ